MIGMRVQERGNKMMGIVVGFCNNNGQNNIIVEWETGDILGRAPNNIRKVAVHVPNWFDVMGI
jgi:hypothetical protein